MKSKFILLHPKDNILVCCQQANVGEIIDIDEENIVLRQNIDLGHKISRQALSKGNKIIKYGVSIGSSLQNIEPGEHVHLHNMKSDYIPPHTRERLQDTGDYE